MSVARAAAAVDGAPAPVPEPPHPRTDRRWAWGVGAVVVLAVLAAGLSAIGRKYLPVGDDATIEMLVRDVGHHTPLVGFNSRFTWNHPGPWTFWLLAIPYELAGRNPSWLLVGAGVIDAAAVGAFAWVAFRRGGLSLLVWAGFLLMVLCRSTGFETLRDPWNPWIAVLPFALFLLAAWAVVDGDLPVLPVAALAGSYAFDNHAGYAVLFVGLGAWMLAWVVGRAVALRRSGDLDAWRAHRRRLALWVGVSLVLFLVFWSPVLYEQLIAHHPGNVTRMYDFFTTDDAPRTTLRHGLDIFGAEVGLRAPWLGWTEQVSHIAEYQPQGAWTAVVPVLVFLATGVWAWRRRAWSALRLHGTVAIAFALGFASVIELRGTQYPYLFRWAWVIGMFLVLASGWAVLQCLASGPRERVRRIGVPVLAAATVVVAVAMVATQWSDPLPLEAFEGQSAALVRPTVAALRGDKKTVLVTPAGYGLVVPFGAVVAGLEAAGIDAKVPNRFFLAYGRHRALADGETAQQVVSVAETPKEIARLEADPNQRLVARFTPRSAADRANHIPAIAVFVSNQPVTGGPPPVPWG